MASGRPFDWISQVVQFPLETILPTGAVLRLDIVTALANETARRPSHFQPAANRPAMDASPPALVNRLRIDWLAISCPPLAQQQLVGLRSHGLVSELWIDSPLLANRLVSHALNPLQNGFIAHAVVESFHE